MTTSTATQILFIDSRVTSADSLLAGLDSSIEIVWLSADRDGLDQIAETLAGRTGIGAVHVVSHGGAGYLTLGAGVVDTASLAAHAAQMDVIRAALTDSADLLLYGCDVAAGDAGTRFIDALAGATGADVAASTDLTGGALMGGNWTLEAATGTIETAAIAPAAYDDVLAPSNAGFESDFTGWVTSDAVIGTGSVYSAGSNNWTVNPYGSKMAVIQPAGASGELAGVYSALKVGSAAQSYLNTRFSNPTNFGYVYTDVTLTAGETFQVAWNYVATDYSPYNDASWVSLVNTSNLSDTSMSITPGAGSTAVSGQVSILGATVTGTGNYVTGNYGSTGWQTATIVAGEAGTYRLGFAVFNLADTILSPYLFVDQAAGTTLKNGTPFGPVAAPAVLPPPPPASNVAPVFSSPAVTYSTGSNTFADTAGDDSFVTAVGKLNATDADGNPLTFSVAGGSSSTTKATAYGTFTITNASTGAFTYTPNNGAIQALKSSVTDSFSITVSDGKGGTATTTLSFAINGVNDTTVFGGSHAGAVQEDGTTSASGTVTASDRDTGDAAISASAAASIYGTFIVDASGNWTYALKNGSAAVQGLNGGAVVYDSFTVHTAGGADQTVTITVTGVNDRPTLSSNAALLTLAEDASPANGQTVATLFGGRFADADAGASFGGILVSANAATAGQGAWYYKAVGGAWTAIPTGGLSTSNALALASTTQIKFIPAHDYNGTPGGLTVFAADDQYAGGFSTSAGPVLAATSGEGVSTAAVALSITISPVNDAPVFTAPGDIAVSFAETAVTDLTGALVSVAGPALSGTLAATDVENDPLLYSIQGGATVGSLSILQGTYGQLSVDLLTGAWSYLPNKTVAINALDAGEVGLESFTLHVTDPSGANATKQLNVSVIGANDTPIVAASVADQGFAGPGEWVYQIPVGTVTDAEGTGLTYTATLSDGNALPGWLHFDPVTRTLSGNPPKSLENTAFDVTLTVTDNHGVAVSDTFTVALGANLNDVPTGAVSIVNDSSAPRGTASPQQGDVLSVGNTLVDGDGLGPIAYTWYANGVVIGNGGSHVLTQADVGKFISVVASYTDAGGVTESMSSAKTGAVINTNDAPTGAPTATLAQGTEDNVYHVTQADLLKGFSDADGDMLDVIGLIVLDGNGQPLVGASVSAKYPDGSYAITLPPNASGDFQLAYQVTDGIATAPAVQTFGITAVNDAPSGLPAGVLANGTEDQPYLVYATDLLNGLSDAENDSLSVINLQADHGSIEDNGDGTFTIIPNPNYNGLLTLSYSVIDGHGGAAGASPAHIVHQYLNIVPVDDGPVLLSPATDQSVLPGDTLGFSAAVYFGEVEGQSLSYSATLSDGSPLPGWISFDPSTGNFTAAPGAGDVGTLGITVVASDGNSSLQTTFALDVPGVTGNAAPGGTPNLLLPDGVEDMPYVVFGADLLSGMSDADGGSLSIVSLQADHGTVVDNGSGIYIVTPEPNYNGPVNLTYDVLDGQGGKTVVSQQFVLTPVNDAPTLATPLGNVIALQGTPITPFTVGGHFAEADGAALNYTATLSDGSPLPGWLDFDPATGTFSGTPDASVVGALGVKVVAYDGVGVGSQSVQASFLLTVTSTPSSTDDSVSTLKDTPIVLSIGDFGDYYDPQGGAEHYVIITGLPAHGTLAFDNVTIAQGDLANTSGLPSGTSPLPTGEVGYWVSVDDILAGKLVFTPEAGYHGPVDIAFKVEKNPISYTSYTLAIDVADTNDPPVLTDTPTVLTTTAEDTAKVVTLDQLLHGYTDPEGQPLLVVGLSADHGTVTDNGNNTYTITPELDYNGTIVLSYGVSDGVNTVATDLNYNLTPVNDAPALANPVGDKTLADVQAGITLPSNIFTDVDGDVLTVTPTQTNGDPLPAWMTWDGNQLKLTGTPPGGTPYIDILLTASDGNGGDATSTFRISLTAGATGNGVETANNPGSVTVGASTAPVGGVYPAGTVLTANVSDVDGYNSAIAYQWQMSADGVSGWSAIPNATSSQLTLGLTESDQYVRVSAYYTDGGNILETPVSSPAIHVALQDHAGAVAIGGTPAAGYTLAATLTDSDGLTGASPTYTWQADGVTVQSSSSNAYTLTNSEGGKLISVQVSYTDDKGFATTVSATDPNPIQLGSVPPVPAAQSTDATEKGGIANATGGSGASGNLLSGATDGNAGDVITFDSVRTGSVAGLGAPALIDPSNPAYVVLDGTYGQLRVELATGAYTYTLFDTHANVQALRAGEAATESFNYTLKDSTDLTGTNALTITVHGTDDAPGGSGLVASATVTEDIATAVDLSALALTDVDGIGTDTYTLTLSVATAGAVLTATSGGGVTVAGSASGSLSLTGTLAALNTFIANAGALHYTGKLNDDTSDTLTVTLQDVTSVGKPVVSLGTVAVDITPVNDAATLDLDADNSSGVVGTGYAAGYTARSHGAVHVVDSDVTILDPDHVGATPDTITMATVAIASGALDNLFGSYETLTAQGASIVTVGDEVRFKFANYDAADSSTYLVLAGNGSAKLSFIGTGSWAQYQDALRTVLYDDANPNASAGARSVTVSIQDGALTTGSSDNSLTTVATATINVIWAPVVDLDGEATANVDDRSYAITYTENGAPLAIAAPDASITDLDGNIKQVQVSLRSGDPSAPIGAADHLSISPSIVTLLASKGITTVVSGDAHTVTFTGNADGSVFQLGLRAVKYSSTSDSPAQGLVRYVDVTTVDMQDHVGVGATTTINIVPVNDAPSAVADTHTVGEAGGLLNGTPGSSPAGNVLANDTDPDAYLSSNPAQAETKAVSAVGFGLTAGTVGQPLAGQYGSLTLNADGSFSYTVNDGNATVQALRAVSDTLTEVFTYTVVDGGGLTSTSTLTVTITGANDTPVITVAPADSAAAGLTETDAGLGASGTLSVEDVDLLDTVTASVTGVVASGATTGLAADNATLLAMLGVDPGAVIDASHTTGTLHWNFASGSEAFNYLAAGQQLVLTYTVSVSDGQAGSTHSVVVTVTGTNDSPTIGVIAQTDLNEQSNAAALTTTIPVVFNDVDLADVGHTAAITAVHVSGQTAGLALGDAALIALVTPGMVIKPAGASVGVLGLGFSAPASAFDYLAAGQQLSLIYTVAIDDGDGGIASRDFVVSLTGTNDAPILVATDVAGAVSEVGGNGLLADSGSLSFADVDLTDLPTASFVVQSIQAVKADGLTPLALSGAQQIAIGDAFSLAPDVANTHDGSVAWHYAIGEAALDFLGAGEQVTAVFTVTVADGHGGSAAQNVTVTLTGTNDVPQLTAVDVTGALVEQGGSGTLSDSGSISFTDVDLTDLPTASQVLKSLDAVKHDGVTPLALSGSQAIALINAFSLSSAVGNTHDGSIDWTYAIAEADVDFLGQGDTVTAVFTVTVADGHGGFASQDVTVTLTGTNDAPILDLNGAGAGVDTDVMFNARGDAVSLFAQDASGNLTQLVLTDKDDGDLIDGISLTLAPGDALDNLGDVTYETLFSTHGSGSFSYDGYTLTIAGNGTSGSPLTISGAGSVAAYKAALTTLQYIDTNQNAYAGNRAVTVTVTDVGTTLPGGNAAPLSASATLTVNVNWNPVVDLNGPGSQAGLPVDANVQRDYLTSFVEKQPTTTYIASNKATLFDQNGLISRVEVDLTNAQDGAAETLSIGAGVVSILAGLGIATTVSADHHSVVFEAVDATGRDVSQFQIGVRGVAYANSSNAPTESVLREVTVVPFDTDGAQGVSATAYIGVQGVNVPPTLQSVSGGSVAEVDLAGSAAWTEAGLSGILVGADEDLQTLTYGISGGTTGGSYAPAALTYDVSKAGSYGTLYVKSATGDYLYVPDSAKVNALSAGEAQTESFTVTVYDGVAAPVTQTYTLNLTGTNDAPTLDVLASDLAGGVTERPDGAPDENTATLTDSGSLSFADVDVADSHVPSIAASVHDGAGNLVAAPLGSLSLDSLDPIAKTVGWNYSVPAGLLDGLAAGETLTQVYSVSITDNHGASVTQDITVTLTGTNDAPVLTADTDTARERGGLANGVAGFDATGDVLANDSDVDLADTLHVVEIAAVTGSGSATAVAAGSTSSAGYVEVAGAYGVLRIGADGSYTYLVDEQNAAVQALRTAADTLQDVFSYGVGDGTTQVASTLTVSVEGANDAPTLIHISNTALTEITGPNATTASIVDVGTLCTDDPDDGDSFTYDIIGGAQQFYFQIASVAGVPTLQLKAGVPLNAEFLSAYSVVVRSTDALGLSTFQTFVVSIGDVNEFQVSTPVFDVEPMGVGIAPNTVAENTPVGTFIGVTASASDADASNNTITYSLVGSLAGAPYTANEFTIDPATGQISVAGPIDRETGGDSRTVFVKALSADGSSKIGSLQVFVSDVNEFAVGAASDADASANTVLENAAVGMQVGVTALATDADATTNAVSYSLVNADGSAYTGGEFAIGAGSGVVTVAGSIDREVGATRTLYVRATSADGSHADQAFIINVGDVNEFAVTQPVDADLGANAVVENAAVGTTVGVTALATDADATTNAVSYSLVNADGSAYTGGEFAVGAGSGVVTVAGNIDREAGATRTLYVRATSADGSHADQSFVVSVADLNDNAPVFVSGTSGSVAENAPTATVIYTAQTSDADATAVNRSVTYALAAGGDAALLDIDAATGAVTLKASADFETQSSYSFIVQALDGANVTSQAVTVTVQNVEEAAVGSLAVSGAAEQGGTLTASLTASDVDGAITAVAYQWQQRIGDVWHDIPGATGVSYTLIADQSVVGSVGRVVATTTDVFGGTTAFVSGAVTIANVNDAPTGKPAVAGTATQGETLSASVGNLADADGLGVISYQWLADGTAIGGATGSTLVLGEAQVGREISVLASYTDGFGHAESVASNRTVAVRNVNDAPTGGVAIVGTAIQNATLAVVSTLADADGLGVVTYKWMSGATQLGTGSSYTLGAADVGRSIHVVASWTDGHGTSESVSSATTSAVANVNDAPTGSLDVTGNAEQGQTLSAVSTLADADGMGTIAYQWLADGVAIAGATGSNLTLTPDQVGKAISVQASWTDGQGGAEHVTSAATAKINAVSTQQEGNAPSLGGGTAGDGNGDGIPDATQSAVVSAPVTVTSSGASSYVTLVADSTAGKVAEGSTSTVTSFNQTATAAYMPASSLTPLGSVNFSASTDTVSGLEHFSLYVDSNLGINGYWVTNADGTLINLASDAYGGRMVVEGDKLRLDFQIQDGGTLDHDGSANGNVQVDGAVGYVPLSLIAYTPDAPAQHDTTQIWD